MGSTYKFRSWGDGTDYQVVAIDTISGAMSARTAGSGSAVDFVIDTSDTVRLVRIEPKYSSTNDANGKASRNVLFYNAVTRVSNQQDVNECFDYLRSVVSWNFPEHAARNRTVKLAVSGSAWDSSTQGARYMMGHQGRFYFNAPASGSISVPNAAEEIHFHVYADDLTNEGELDFSMPAVSAAEVPRDWIAGLSKIVPATLTVRSVPSQARVTVAKI